MAERPGVVVALKRKLKRYKKAGLDTTALEERIAFSENPERFQQDEPESRITHLGGGWYQVGDEKAQGREAAEALLEEN